MIALLVSAVLVQNTDPEILSLVHDLGSDQIEVREQAHRRLLEVGMPAVAALRRAATSGDAELAGRARAIWLAIDRPQRELEHDAREREKLIARLHPDFVKAWVDKPLKFEGAYFEFSAFKTSRGVIIRPEVHELLRRYEGRKIGNVWMRYEITPETPGKTVDFEKCAICNSILIPQPPASAPFKMRIRGVQTWFSRYDLEFRDPKDGDKQLVGDMTVEVAWPEIVIRSGEGWEEGSLPLRNPRFQYDLRPEAKFTRPPVRGNVESFGCGAGLPPPPGWCWCINGPLRVSPTESPRQVHELRLKVEEGIPLEAVSTIRCVAWKPLRIPIDFTVDVNPR